MDNFVPVVIKDNYVNELPEKFLHS